MKISSASPAPNTLRPAPTMVYALLSKECKNDNVVMVMLRNDLAAENLIYTVFLLPFTKQPRHVWGPESSYVLYVANLY